MWGASCCWGVSVVVRGGGVFHAVGGGLHLGVALVDVRLDVVPLPPSSSSATVRVVGWVGFLLDMIGGVESVLWEGYYRASALTMGSVCSSMSSSCLRGQVRFGGCGSSLPPGVEFGRSRTGEGSS